MSNYVKCDLCEEPKEMRPGELYEAPVLLPGEDTPLMDKNIQPFSLHVCQYCLSAMGFEWADD